MARILAISSQVAHGPVGLTALVPALQAQGHEVLAVPTITLSNHPGHGPPAGFRTTPESLRVIFAALKKIGALENLDAILTGYFASAEQVQEAAALIRARQRPGLTVLVDPVIGDDTELYVPLEVAIAIRDELLPLATIATPNAFELAWLTGAAVHDEASALAAARSLAAAEMLATSVPDGDDLLTLLVTPDAIHRRAARRLDHVPHGTGDFLSGAFLAERLAHLPAEAFARAMATLNHAIAISAGSAVLDVARALHTQDSHSKHPAP